MPPFSIITAVETVQFQAVPEPQTWVVAFAGLGTLIAMQRFRRTRKPPIPGTPVMRPIPLFFS